MSNLLLTSSVRSWIAGVLYSIALWIDGIIFYFVSLAYRVFFVVSRANLFSGDELTTLTHRVYIILGVVMLFVFAYNILVMIAQPDNLFGKDDNSMGSLAKNMIISIVLLTLLPTIFSYMQKVQDGVVESNVIGNVLLGSWSDSEEGFSVREAGTNTALLILGAFYHPIVEGESVNSYDCDVLINEEAVDPRTNICVEYLATYLQAQELERISILTSNDVLIDGIHAGSMNYMPIVSWVAGAFAAYLFVSFSMDIGVRVAKLGFLQVIAPIPVVLRITKPKGGAFERWKKELTTTYLSLFVRLIFIFFSMYVISLVPNVLRNLFPTIWGQELSGNGTFNLLNNLFAFGNIGAAGASFANGIVRLTAQAILILGILKFAKDGPKMIEDLFQIEHLQISIRKKLGENEYGMRAISAVGAGVGTMASNVYKGIKEKDAGGAVFGGISGLVGGARRGWQHGGVDDISKLGGAINTARQETDAAREGRARFADDWSNKGLAGAIGDRVGEKIKDAGSWLGGEYSDKKLEALKGLDDLFEQMSDTVGGAAWKSLTNARNAATQNINDPEKADLLREGLLREGYWYDSGGGVMVQAAPVHKPDQATYDLTTAAGRTAYATDMAAFNTAKAAITSKEVAAHFKERRAQMLADKAKDSKVFENYSETYMDTLRKSISDIGKDSVDEALQHADAFGAGATLDDLQRAFTQIADSSTPKTVREQLTRQLVEVSDQINAKKKEQIGAQALKKAQEKK